MDNSQYSISDISKNFGRLAFCFRIKTKYIDASDYYIVGDSDLSKFFTELESYITDESQTIFDFPTDKLDSDKYITLEKTDNLGHFTLSAQFGNSWHDDIAKLKIKIDQTDIQHILSALKTAAN